METKFGNAELWGNGYYYITSTKEGNFKKQIQGAIGTLFRKIVRGG